MIKSICLTSSFVLALSSSVAFADTVSSDSAQDAQLYKVTENVPNSYELARSESSELVLPCPFGWSVQPNPSVDNSLSYVDADGTLAISVTSLVKVADPNVTSELYSKVAAEQMNCSIPTRSNLIEDAWTFDCSKEKIESIVYGEKGELALLVISGRNPNTESKLEEFIKFLASESKK